MFTGRYGYGKQFECQEPVILTLEQEANGSSQGFEAVYNRLVKNGQEELADAIFDKFADKWENSIK